MACELATIGQKPFLYAFSSFHAILRTNQAAKFTFENAGSQEQFQNARKGKCEFTKGLASL